MKAARLTALVLSVLLLAGAAGAQGTSKADRDALIKDLKESQKALQKATKGLSEEQWNWKAAPERWSVAECVTHLALTEQFLRDTTQALLKEPATPGKKPATVAKEQDDMIIKRVGDRSQKAQAPEPLQPKNNPFPSGPAAMKAFDERRAATIQWVKGEKEDLRAHMADSPLMKEMDAYQWVLLMAEHTKRHTAQALEVKADPSFPKKKSRY